MFKHLFRGIEMKLRIVSTRIVLSAIGLLAAAAPSYAGWGAFSGYAFAANNQGVICTYSANGQSLAGILSASRKTVSIAPFGYIIFDDAVFGNVFATANVFLAGYDHKDPNNGSNWPIMYFQNGVAAGQTLDFGTVTNENFQDLFNLQAGCEVGN
ncbi:MAG TPA: hypothetical protein VET48_14590 [Steroidobacteraceae bacterium]|nr:hypothetical protein [Steroidobacteraceae bacterium]